ncbi:ECF transporter S component [Pseudarthrobacter sp. AL07]|uniref:general stress protein n=1 Tax=unclassified Pseudarthrobacter TaxID=2647000 RepID=UPI002499F088|nr:MULTISPECIES: general stress protein [unclassified Pseudarthrobacter]MDI3193177.1 ECF transporter S component [Pseudarthrobacter sp. AL20]MDI3207003.1 ECF transporter S component [Pseudarthrobacter sp. AL07]
MSNIFGAPKAGGPSGPDDARTVPTGDTVGSYTSYLDAQKAVDYLADQQFPVHMVSIVGNELKMVERVTGRLSYPRVALSGALSGMWFGLFVGVMLSFFAPSPGYFSILASVLMGAAFFMLFGIVTYAMQRGKRDFTSTSQVVATNYDVVVSAEAAHDARRLLQQLPMNRSDAAAAPYNPQGYQSQQSGETGQQYGQTGQQPGEQDQPGSQPGPAPARPASWNDPYGQQGAGTPGQGTIQDVGHAAGPEQGAQPEAAAQPAKAPAAAVRYPDLPDGRPQYGVRVTDQATTGQPGSEQHGTGQRTTEQAQTQSRPDTTKDSGESTH